MANYLQINKCATQDGPGVRVSVYLAGCSLHCPGCHNPAAWDRCAGNELTPDIIHDIIRYSFSDYVAGLSILGGEPLDPHNVKASLSLAKSFKFVHPGKSIWVWSGYEWDELMERCESEPELKELLSYIDVTVVGRFKLDERDITKENLWRGSRNQRVIKCKESLHSGKIAFLENISNNS